MDSSEPRKIVLKQVSMERFLIYGKLSLRECNSHK